MPKIPAFRLESRDFQWLKDEVFYQSTTLHYFQSYAFLKVHFYKQVIYLGNISF